MSHWTKTAGIKITVPVADQDQDQEPAEDPQKGTKKRPRSTRVSTRALRRRRGRGPGRMRVKRRADPVGPGWFRNNRLDPDNPALEYSAESDDFKVVIQPQPPVKRASKLEPIPAGRAETERRPRTGRSRKTPAWAVHNMGFTGYGPVPDGYRPQRKKAHDPGCPGCTGCGHLPGPDGPVPITPQAYSFDDSPG